MAYYLGFRGTYLPRFPWYLGWTPPRIPWYLPTTDSRVLPTTDSGVQVLRYKFTRFWFYDIGVRRGWGARSAPRVYDLQTTIPASGAALCGASLRSTKGLGSPLNPARSKGNPKGGDHEKRQKQRRPQNTRPAY